MARVWRFTSEAPEGKYLVKRRDGSIPEWPFFVLGARDPAASAALHAYAAAAEELGYDPEYVSDIRALASSFSDYCATHGAGDPDASKHRKDDPTTVKAMRQGRGA